MLKEEVLLQKAIRPRVDDLDLSIGKKTRLHRIFEQFSPGKGRVMILPIDQGLEHGPVDFFENPHAANPEYQLSLAVEGNFSAIAFHIGLAEKYLKPFAGKVPVILKINGKTAIPSDAHAFSPLTGTVEDAVRLGADAVGYTLYVGSPAQDRDIHQFMEVRKEAEKYGMPVVMWAYPRGEAIQTKGGKESLYAVEYAARVACELGADVVKVNFPKIDNEKQKDSPAPYNTLKVTFAEAVQRVTQAAGRTFVIMSGGEKVDSEEKLLERVKIALESGAAGIIFGRNLWQRPYTQGLQLAQKISKLMAET
ncbi:MAG: fructose-bisphosphate aldolase [Firmicutes bacterium]|nr:fructose-bisphosphate aldolase [Bacillota bacterium]